MTKNYRVLSTFSELRDGEVFNEVVIRYRQRFQLRKADNESGDMALATQISIDFLETLPLTFREKYKALQFIQKYWDNPTEEVTC